MKSFITFSIVLMTFLSCGPHDNTPKNEPTDNKNLVKKKILIILTSHSEMGDTGEKTGLWLEEFTTPFYYFKDLGAEISLASPKGGQPPIDPRSELPKNESESTKRFMQDQQAQNQLSKTLLISAVNPSEFDGVFYPGGHGSLWDLAEDVYSISIIESFYSQKKPIGAVCHGPAVFKKTREEDGEFIVKGKKVTGFSDAEEQAAGFEKVVPFLVEDMLKENGGIYSSGENWQPHTEMDGLLITGQNPKSSLATAQLFYDSL